MEQFRRVHVSIHGKYQNMSEESQDRSILSFLGKLKLIRKEKEMWNIRLIGAYVQK